MPVPRGGAVRRLSEEAQALAWICATLATALAFSVAVLATACAHAPPPAVVSGARCLPASVPAASEAAVVEDTASQVLGWALGLAAAGAAGAPTGAALDGLDASQRAAVVGPALVSLAAGAVLLWRWGALLEVAGAWRTVVVCGPGELASEPWREWVPPDPGPRGEIGDVP
jgi:hypothetical protein